MSRILDTLCSPADLKRLSLRELEVLAEEIREEIIRTVSKNGGHLASSLGVVELTIALQRVLGTPENKIVWDVGHQAYAHKLLTGRLRQFSSLRQLGGISGFPKRSESPHDSFDVGHSSTSISAALGMAAARDARGGKEKIIAVIGDGSLTAGLAFEGLNQAGHLKKNLIVILNDNEMSISPNVGALSSFFSRKMTSDFFIRLKKETENFLSSVPGLGRDLITFAKRAEESVKSFLTPGMLFEAFGFDYVGPIKGHRLDRLLETLQNASRLDGPVLIHVITKKGKGYKPAEENPALFHGVGPFDVNTGKVLSDKGGAATFTGVFGRTMVELAEKDRRVVAISAAMSDGTGLGDFSRRFPDRFFDVGIAEQHAVTFAAGLACQGLRPVVALYSTFLQRAYDNVLHDVCLQNLPVTFALDRGGLVGADGPTHHGNFDISYLRHIPNITIAVPRDEQELRRVMLTALQHDGPFAYRYPRGNGLDLPWQDNLQPFEIGKGELLSSGQDGVIFAVGVSVQEALKATKELAAQGLSFGVVDARFVKPLDTGLLLEQARNSQLVVTVEENALQGGFGSAVAELLVDEGIGTRLVRIGLPDRFIEQGSQTELRTLCGIDAKAIVRRILSEIQPQRSAKTTTRAMS